MRRRGGGEEEEEGRGARFNIVEEGSEREVRVSAGRGILFRKKLEIY